MVIMLVPEIVCLMQVLSMGMMIVRTIQNVDQELVWAMQVVSVNLE